MKQGYHISVSRVETRRFQAMGQLDGFSVYSPVPRAPAAAPTVAASRAPAAPAAQGWNSRVCQIGYMVTWLHGYMVEWLPCVYN
jgi:hypothetical protein